MTGWVIHQSHLVEFSLSMCNSKNKIGSQFILINITNLLKLANALIVLLIYLHHWDQ